MKKKLGELVMFIYKKIALGLFVLGVIIAGIIQGRPCKDNIKR